uniref:Uncharacterized protein n=1 Tax=Romanomermis culicivorax TaxID=13658 RepID=A0A915I8G2_ROMCU
MGMTTASEYGQFTQNADISRISNPGEYQLIFTVNKSLITFSSANVLKSPNSPGAPDATLRRMRRIILPERRHEAIGHGAFDFMRMWYDRSFSHATVANNG